MGNKLCKPEVTQMVRIKSVKSGVNKEDYGLSVRPLVIPSHYLKSIKEYDMDKDAPVFNAANPLYIEYEEPTALNCFKCTGNLRAIGTGGGTSTVNTGTMFYLDYSLNGEDYVEAGSVATTGSNGVFTLDFPEVTAKYWRVRTNYSNTTNVLGLYDAGDTYFTLNRKDPYIVFTEAPAAGDTLTMDVLMDRVLKNDKFVVDLSCRIDFSI
jgi:hypothetical protein